jgi:teichuronic acid exporter
MAQKFSSISIKKAAFINGTAQYSTVVLNLVFSAILARLLTPEDYGIVAITTVFTTFFGLFADIGLGSAVIQNKKMTPESVNHIFSFTVWFGLLLAGLFCIFSVPISRFYNNAVLIPICCILSVSLFFNTLNSIPNALLLKEQKFVVLAVRTIITTVSTSIVTIILAYHGFKYYALVIQSVFSAIFIFIWNLSNTKISFTFHIKKESFNGIINFSFWQFADKFVNYFSRNLDNLLVGKIFGQASLGIYDKAYRLMLYPIQNFTRVITPVLHPILSVFQNDRNYIYQKYLKLLKLLSLAGVLVSPVCFFCAREIILIMFGERWQAAIPCLRFLSLSIWAQMTTSSTGAIFQSLGNTKLMFRATIEATVVTVICILAGIMHGSITAISLWIAVGLNCSFLINYFHLIKNGFGKKFIPFLCIFIPDLITFCLMMVCMAGISSLSVSNLFASLFLKGLTGCVVFCAGLLITGQKKYFIIVYKKIEILRAGNLVKKTEHANPVMGINTLEKRDKKIIISLTSYPARFSTLSICIKSLLNQTVKPDKVILYLGTDSEAVKLPESLLDLQNYGLTIKKGYEDIRPHKKYLYAMREYPEDIIITADDDLIYDKNLVRDLIRSYRTYPAAVSARRVHLMKTDAKEIKPYHEWGLEYKKICIPTHTLLPTNGAGSLFPPHCLPQETFEIEKIRNLCLNADDIWLKFMLLKQGTKVVWVKSRHSMPVIIPQAQEKALYHTNMGNNTNDAYIRTMEQAYGIHLSDYGDRKK